jgi:hypothetical protein
MRKPSFAENVTVVITKKVRTINEETNNPEYTLTELYNGDAWRYREHDWLAQFQVPVAKTSIKILVPSTDTRIDQDCHITIDGEEYMIIDAVLRRGILGANHTEIRVEGRTTK